MLRQNQSLWNRVVELFSCCKPKRTYYDGEFSFSNPGYEAAQLNSDGAIWMDPFEVDSFVPGFEDAKSSGRSSKEMRRTQSERPRDKQRLIID